jgi:PAS domain S-box-containing protein
MLLLGLLLNNPTAYSASVIDSLEQAIITAHDSTKLELYSQLSEIYYNLDIQKSIEYDSLGLILAQQNNARQEEGIFLNNLGSDYYGLSDFSQGHFFFSNAKLIFTETKDTANLVKTLNNLGLIYQVLGFYKISADYFASAIHLKRYVGEVGGLITTLNNIAILYNKVGLYEEGINFLNEALELSLSYEDSTLTSLTYQDLALLTLSLKQYKLSIDHAQKALIILPVNRYNEQCALNTSMALAYEGLNQNTKARSYFKRAIGLFNLGVSDYEKANTLVSYAGFLNARGSYDAALQKALEALKLSNDHDFKEIQGDLFKLLATIYQQKKKFDIALEYLIKSNIYNDSIHSQNLTSSLMLIALNEKVVQVNHDRQLLESKNILQSQQIDYSQKLLNVMISASALLMLLLLVILYYVRQKRKDNNILHQLNLKLSESEEKYKAVVEQSPEIMFIHQNGKLLFANQHFYDLSGYNAQEMELISVYDLLKEEEKERIVAMSRERLKGNLLHDSYELKALNKNKEVIYLNMSFNRISYNNQSAILGIGNDITSRKANLETIKKLTAAIEQSPIMILIANKEGTIEYVNPAFSQITGFTYEEAVGNYPNILSSGEVNVHIYRELWQTILNGQIWRGELPNKKKNGEMYWESLVISPILDEKNNITHFVAIMEDISKRKIIEDALHQREEALHHANVTKDKFFSIIAHDLKNPFNAILGFSSLLMAEYDNITDAEKRSYIENITMAANTTYRLLENLLEWSRTQTGKIKFVPANFDLNAVINEIMNLHQTQASRKGIKLISEVPFNTMVFADKNMVRTVLRNLFSNAVKFSASGEVRISARQVKNMTEVCITDKGVGIPEEGLEKLFRLDEQYLADGTEYEKGTGLGLILSKEFITKHGGKIWAESKKNVGSKFYFTLPSHEQNN